MSDIGYFLRCIAGDREITDGHLVIFNKPDLTSQFFTAVVPAAQHVTSRSAECEWYVGVGLRRHGLTATQRGGNDDVVALLGLAADIDIAGPAHTNRKNYPPDLASAEKVIAMTGCAPTVLVNSGHGLQAWWLFERPWLITAKDERERAAALSNAWQQAIRNCATKIGFEVDQIGDLARVLRVAGTLNHKIPPAVEVTLLRNDGPRYKPEQLATATDSMAAPAVSPPGGTVAAATTVSPTGGTDDGASDIVLDPAAEPPAEKFQQLMRTPKFRASWERSRTDLTDSSASGYDMSLACFALSDGWSRQEIVDLLIAHRRHHNDDRKLRDDYYARTIDKAGEWLKTHSAPAQPTPAAPKKDDKSQEAQLMAIADTIEIFRTESHQTYATLPADAGSQTLSVKGGALRAHLCHSYYTIWDVSPRRDAVSNVIEQLDALAQFGDRALSVYRRVARVGQTIYIDLGDATGRVVAVTPAGWNLVQPPPVRFVRSQQSKPLPEPIRGGQLTDLRRLVNVASDADFLLLIAWLVGALGGLRSYPILALQGPQGSGKSTISQMLKMLIDPATHAATRSAPRVERDLFVAASHAHVLAFTNISYLDDRLSDALCRVASGEGFAVRKLYTDAEEAVFDGARPMIVNGIEEFLRRPDLLDRSIVVQLPMITAEDRQLERDMWKQFDALHPKLLGALLDAVSEGLRNEAVVQPQLPRMADFAQWVTACEPALPWEQGHFMTAYTANLAAGADVTIESSPVALAIKQWIATGGALTMGEWCDSPTELLRVLNLVDDSLRSQKGWPQNASQLSNKLRRVAPALRQRGIEIDRQRDGTRSALRRIHIRQIS